MKVFGRIIQLIAFFPATVGSEEKPTPSGTLKVTSIDANPYYRYNPDYKFKGVKSKQPFTIKPGPNNPGGQPIGSDFQRKDMAFTGRRNHRR